MIVFCIEKVHYFFLNYLQGRKICGYPPRGMEGEGGVNFKGGEDFQYGVDKKKKNENKSRVVCNKDVTHKFSKSTFFIFSESSRHPTSNELMLVSIFEKK